MNLLVLCLGNDIRSDDGVGWAVADELSRPADHDRRESLIPNPQPLIPVIRRTALSGFYLLDELVGYDRVIVVDAVKTGVHPPGTVLSFPFEALGTEAGPSPHAVGLPSVVKLGRQSGVPLPTGIHIVAIEVDDMETIAEGLTTAVRDAVPRAVAEVQALVAACRP